MVRGYDTIGSLLNGQFSHIMDKEFVLRSERYVFRGLDLLDLDLAYEGIRFQRHECRRGCGGIFAPSLYLGCIAGFIFAHTSNYFPFTMYILRRISLCWVWRALCPG